MSFLLRIMAAAAIIGGVAGGALLDLRKESRQGASLFRRTIVLVVLDATRLDELGVYGGDRRTTPHIDRLAKEGIRYAAAYAPDSFTVPSHSALFCGQLTGPGGPLLPSLETLPENLKTRGFRTIGVSANWLLGSETGFGRGFDFFTNVVDEKTRKALEEKRPIDDEERRRSAKGSAVVGTLKQAVVAVGADESLFLFVNLFDPHDPYTPDAPFRQRFAPGVASDGHLRDGEGGLAGFFRRAPSLSRGERRDLRRLYRAEVAQADAAFGAIRELVRSSGREEEALFVVTADHGELFGEKGAWTHNVGLSEEEVHVPLVVRGPGIPAGRVEEEPVGLTDLKEAITRWAAGDEWVTEPSKPLLFHHVYPGNEATSDRLIKTDAIGLVHGDWRITRAEAGCRLFRRASPYWAEVPCSVSSGRGAPMIALLNDEVRSRIGVARLRSWIEGRPTAEWIRKLRSLGYIN